jgi:hypothetical protein
MAGKAGASTGDRRWQWPAQTRVLRVVPFPQGKMDFQLACHPRDHTLWAPWESVLPTPHPGLHQGWCSHTTVVPAPMVTCKIHLDSRVKDKLEAWDPWWGQRAPSVGGQLRGDMLGQLEKLLLEAGCHQSLVCLCVKSPDPFEPQFLHL